MEDGVGGEGMEAGEGIEEGEDGERTAGGDTEKTKEHSASTFMAGQEEVEAAGAGEELNPEPDPEVELKRAWIFDGMGLTGSDSMSGVECNRGEEPEPAGTGTGSKGHTRTEELSAS